jgi:Mlc titration factor MtfA (ptsG expression regulator)
MAALILVAALCAGLALVFGLPQWRLKRVLARPIDPAWQATLARTVPIYTRMSGELRQQLDQLVKQFLHQKKFVGCGGLDVDDEIRLTIAGQACLLLLNRRTRVYPELRTVLVYPSAFMAPRQQVDAAGVVTEARQDLLGESWGDGRVVLSWDHVQRGAHEGSDGHNVVLHEFAHQLDSESGSNNGAPYLGSQTDYRSWSEVLSRDFANLQVDALYRQHSVMDHYGATSPAEFFAVATETFFEKPWQMAEHHGALFSELFKYYRVDPRAWQDAPPQNEPQSGSAYGQWQ